eukprot:PhM_4_TR9132/c0_g2_i1/m.34691
MQIVPTEVLDHILCYAAGSITALSLVCSTWRHTVANSDELPAIRWISLSKSAVEGFVEVDATTLTTRPDLRYTGGSCAHQYRLVPHTITADRAALHDELEWARMRTELGVLFVVCANQFSGSEVPLGSMRLNQFCLSEQAVEGESIAEFAKRVTDFFESWCGSESDECTDDESD